MTNIDSYIKIVKEKSKAKRAILRANEFLNLCLEDDHEVNNHIVNLLNDLSLIYRENDKTGFKEIGELVYSEIQKVRDLLRNPTDILQYLTTGLIELDKLTSGIKLKTLTTIAARNGVGKTALAETLAYNIASLNNVAVAFFSLEMPEEEVTWRIICGRSQVNSNKISNQTFTEQDWHRMHDQVPIIIDKKILIDDTPNVTLEDIKVQIKKTKQDNDIKVVIIDYVQLIKTNFDSPNRADELSVICKELKDLSKELDIAIIILAQINRGPENRVEENKRPKTSDIKASGGIEENSDLILLIFREELYDKKPEYKNIAEIIVGKNRSGQIGSFKLAYVKELTRFENLKIE
jgi:replicative DNA helicase